MHSDSSFCHNCGIKLSGPYCAACGQKAVPLSVTLHDFFHELTHETLHVDGRIFQSIRRLLLSPGFLTREYVQGRRARWISPIRLYLVSSVIFFALSALAPFEVGMTQRQSQTSGWSFRIGGSQSGGTIQLDEGQNAEDEAKKLGFPSLAALQAAVNSALIAWVPRVMFVLMPLFAWFVVLAYRRIDANYLHHLIFAVHVHAAFFAAGVIAKAVEVAYRPAGQALLQLLPVLAVIYAVIAFRRVYGKVKYAFARITFVLVAYFIVYVLAFSAIVVPVVFRQVFNRST